MTWTRPLLLEVAAAEPQRLVELVWHPPEEKDAWQRKAEELPEQVRQKNQELSQPLEKLEQAQRAAFRQAAPFRREETERVEHPKRPGTRRGPRNLGG
jgi:hypothetical protein